MLFPRPATLLLAIALLAAAVRPAAPANFSFPEMTLHFHETVLVEGGEYRLGDLASVVGTDEDAVARLESLVLGRSPQLGRRIVLSDGQIEASLRRLAIDQDDALLDVPRRVVIERATQRVALDPVRMAIVDRIVAELQVREDQVVIERLDVPAEAELESGAFDFQVSVRMPRAQHGSAAWEAALLVDGQESRVLRGTCQVDQLVEVLELQRAVRRGEAVTPRELQPVLRPASELRSAALDTAQLASLIRNGESSLRARRDLSAGQALSWNLVEREILVVRGQAVRLELRDPESGLHIQTLGRATENGCLGDLVEAVNAKSGQKVYGTVTGSQRLSVSF